MKQLAAPLCALCLLAGATGTALAFQEYPSLEVTPYVGYLLYDSELIDYQSNLAYGIRLDLRTMAALGFQFHYSRSTNTAELPGQPFVDTDDYVERIQLNLTRDLFIVRGTFIAAYAGGGTFNRRYQGVYTNDYSVQAGMLARRNLFDWLYLRADAGWTGAFIKDPEPDDPYYDRTLTHHFEGALTLSVLFDN